MQEDKTMCFINWLIGSSQHFDTVRKEPIITGVVTNFVTQCFLPKNANLSKPKLFAKREWVYNLKKCRENFKIVCFGLAFLKWKNSGFSMWNNFTFWKVSLIGLRMVKKKSWGEREKGQDQNKMFQFPQNVGRRLTGEFFWFRNIFEILTLSQFKMGVRSN